MKAYYRRNIHKNHYVVEEEQEYQEDYQMRMLRSNKIAGLLEVYAVGIEGKSQYLYDTTGKRSMKSVFGKRKMCFVDMEQFIHCMLATLEAVRRHLLDINCIVLDPGAIFVENETYYFCYCPLNVSSLQDGFHVLTEFLVSQTDYEDHNAIFFACSLHKATMDDNYNLCYVIDSITQEMQKEQRCEEENIPEDMPWQEEVNQTLVQEELPKGFTSAKLKKKLFQGTKKKWGTWDML